MKVLVTGASGGLGAASAAALRSAGASVLGLDLVAGPDVLAADVTDRDAVTAAVGTAVERLGGLDVLVNCAGVGWAQRTGPAPDADARRIIEINLFGTWNTTAAALPALLASPRTGHVVAVASGIAILTLPYGAAYSVSKRGVTAYADVLRLEYAGRLAVTTYYPGYLETGIHDRNVAQGYTVGGALLHDSLEGAGRAMVRAVRRRPRSAYSSAVTGLGLRVGRVLPGPIERELTRRLAKDLAGRPVPEFLRTPDPADPVAGRTAGGPGAGPAGAGPAGGAEAGR